MAPTEDDLARCGIFFQSTVRPEEVNKMPDHVQSLRLTLLDFHCVLTDRLAMEQGTWLDTSNSWREQLGSRASDAEVAETETRILRYRDMCSVAHEKQQGRVSEADWQDYYRRWFLDHLYWENRIQDKDTRK
jgi:hypothetical protein